MVGSWLGLWVGGGGSGDEGWGGGGGLLGVTATPLMSA